MQPQRVLRLAFLLIPLALWSCSSKECMNNFMAGVVDSACSAVDYMQVDDPNQAPYVAQRSLARGMTNSLKACEATLRAANLDSEAQKYDLLRKKIDNDPDFLCNTDNLKYVLDQVNQAVDAADKVAASQKFEQTRAREYLGNGLFFASLAVSNDVLAVKSFDTIISKAPASLGRGGPDQDRGQVILDLADQGMNYLPQHIISLGRISTNIMSYATSNDIEMPSEGEIKQAEDTEKAEIDKAEL